MTEFEEDKSPTRVEDLADRGADTTRRFRIQAAVAAMYALSMLRDDSAIVEIVVEHQDDFIALLESGKFIFTQVKTRALNLGGFALSNDSILHTLARFVSKSIEFPDRIEKFVMISNVGFIESSRRPYTDVDVFLRWFKDESYGKEPIVVSKFLDVVDDLISRSSKISTKTCERPISAEDVKAAMQRVELRSEYFELSAVESLVRDRVLGCQKMECIDHKYVPEITSALINLMLNRAALAYYSAAPGQVDLVSDFSKANTVRRIDARRVSRTDVDAVFDRFSSLSGRLRDDSGIIISIGESWDVTDDDDTLCEKLHAIRAARVRRSRADIRCRFERRAAFEQLSSKVDQLDVEEHFDALERRAAIGIRILMFPETTRMMVENDRLLAAAGAVRTYVRSLNPTAEPEWRETAERPFVMTVFPEISEMPDIRIMVPRSEMFHAAERHAAMEQDILISPGENSDEKRSIDEILADDSPFWYVSDLTRSFRSKVVLPAAVKAIGRWVENSRADLESVGTAKFDVSSWRIRFG